MTEQWPEERKAAEKIVIGDYLPFHWKGEQWWLEVTAVQPKRTRVWITVEEPTSGEQWTTKPAFGHELVFKEAAQIIQEAEARDRAYRGDQP